MLLHLLVAGYYIFIRRIVLLLRVMCVTYRSKAVLLLWFILLTDVTDVTTLIGGGLLYIHSSYCFIIACYVCSIIFVMNQNRT